jgi:hypothetical protein
LAPGLLPPSPLTASNAARLLNGLDIRPQLFGGATLVQGVALFWTNQTRSLALAVLPTVMVTLPTPSPAVLCSLYQTWSSPSKPDGGS